MTELERLATYRLEADLPYAVLAQRIGLPTTTLQRALRTGRANERTRHKVARYLDQLPSREGA